MQDGEAPQAVAQINWNCRQSEGARVCGRKIDLTVACVQPQPGVDQPDGGARSVNQGRMA